MGYQVALTPSARTDLRDIVRYISLDAPERALAFGQFLVGSIRRLADHPEMGRVVPEMSEPDVREIIARSYRIIYRVDHAQRRIDVVRFLARGARPSFSAMSVHQEINFGSRADHSISARYFSARRFRTLAIARADGDLPRPPP